jgi:hypothetical protein
LLLGISLTFGFALKLSGYSGALLMLLMWLAIYLLQIILY